MAVFRLRQAERKILKYIKMLSQNKLADKKNTLLPAPDDAKTVN
ncbi:hypothetical protein J2786_000617 [Chryseobacterium vietnamense]|uniref:Uncharacterized protein n=1 Tax=Chryseobacterium vietnamense TaxID=866785 RepID=A0ACC6J3K4_9FLAO|nr:hypothetical protein [Chryseobacterium vietnamense]